jgi:hypothetical protein
MARKRRLARLIAYVVAAVIVSTALVAAGLLVRYIWRLDPVDAPAAAQPREADAAKAPSNLPETPSLETRTRSGGWFNPLLETEGGTDSPRASACNPLSAPLGEASSPQQI